MHADRDCDNAAVNSNGRPLPQQRRSCVRLGEMGSASVHRRRHVLAAAPSPATGQAAAAPTPASRWAAGGCGGAAGRGGLVSAPRGEHDRDEERHDCRRHRGLEDRPSPARWAPQHRRRCRHPGSPDHRSSPPTPVGCSAPSHLVYVRRTRSARRWCAGVGGSVMRPADGCQQSPQVAVRSGHEKGIGATCGPAWDSSLFVRSSVSLMPNRCAACPVETAAGPAGRSQRRPGELAILWAAVLWSVLSGSAGSPCRLGPQSFV